RPPPDLEICQLPDMPRSGAARDRHARYLLRFLLVFPALLLGPRAGRLRTLGGGILDARRSVYRRRRARRAAPALLALLHPRVEALRLSRSRRAFRRPVHPGHGAASDLSEQRRRMAVPRGGLDRPGRPIG